MQATDRQAGHRNFISPYTARGRTHPHFDSSGQEQAALDDHPQNDSRLTMARTTHRSSSGKKLYAVRDKQGRFKDIQSYKRVHS